MSEIETNVTSYHSTRTMFSTAATSENISKLTRSWSTSLTGKKSVVVSDPPPAPALVKRYEFAPSVDCVESTALVEPASLSADHPSGTGGVVTISKEPLGTRELVSPPRLAGLTLSWVSTVLPLRSKITMSQSSVTQMSARPEPDSRTGF